jgi:acyl carrier protein
MVISEIEQIADRHQKRLAPLTEDSVLMNTGLDSLCFAVLIARLEDRLGVDPFSTSDTMDFPVTLGDFVRVYENAAH